MNAIEDSIVKTDVLVSLKINKKQELNDELVTKTRDDLAYCCLKIQEIFECWYNNILEEGRQFDLEALIIEEILDLQDGIQEGKKHDIIYKGWTRVYLS